MTIQLENLIIDRRADHDRGIIRLVGTIGCETQANLAGLQELGPAAGLVALEEGEWEVRHRLWQAIYGDLHGALESLRTKVAEYEPLDDFDRQILAAVDVVLEEIAPPVDPRASTPEPADA